MSTSFLQSFASSFSFVFITDLTDKSIFLIILLSQKVPTQILLITAALSILSMNFLSILAGSYITKIIPELYIDIIACILFITFGFISMKESFQKDNEAKNLMEKTKKEMSDSEDSNNYVLMNEDNETTNYESNSELKFNSHLRSHSNMSDLSNFSYINSSNYNSLNNNSDSSKNLPNYHNIKNNDNNQNRLIIRNESDKSDSEKEKFNSDNEVSFGLIIRIVSMLCLADMGDKSQITVITMAAIYNIYGVLIGSSLALMITISLAAFFGSWICNKIKPSILLFSGGIIFLVFAAEVLLNILYDILSDK